MLLILLLIPSSIVFHFAPNLIPTIEAVAAAKSNANWFAPPSELSPYKNTLYANKAINTKIGSKAKK